MAEPPDSIFAFYKQIQFSSTQDLSHLAKYVDPAASERTVQLPFLSAEPSVAANLQDAYARCQVAFYRFTGHCQMHCPLRYPHHHSIQAKGMLQLQGFPGVFIFPQFFKPVLPELLDAILELHQGRDDAQGKDTSAQAGGDAPRSSPIIIPLELCDLFHNTFPTEFEQHYPINATLSISTPERSAGLKKPDLLVGNIVHVSLGFDAILVLGDEAADIEDAADEPGKEPAAGQENSWQDLLDFDSDEGGVDDPETSKQEVPPSAANASAPIPNTAALHLRAGDVLAFDDRASTIWYGIAKVLEGSSRVKLQWPHLREEELETGSKVTRGQLNGKAVQVEFQ